MRRRGLSLRLARGEGPIAPRRKSAWPLGWDQTMQLAVIGHDVRKHLILLAHLYSRRGFTLEEAHEKALAQWRLEMTPDAEDPQWIYQYGKNARERFD